MFKILIVEDEEKIRTELCAFLSRNGYECQTVTDFENVVETVLASDAQLVLLDLGLPAFDGNYVCQEIRKVSNVPIMVVTSRSSQMDELMSMNLGADDFVVKPYNPQILLARIGNLLKRSYNREDAQVISYNGLSLDIGKSEAYSDSDTIELTKNELRILHLLMKNSGSIVSRNRLMDELWQSDEFVDDNTLTVNINRLRKKIEQLGFSEFLQTKRGQGYMI